MPVYKILTINPGSTSTKLALFENDKPVISETVRHNIKELSQFSTILDQFQYRKNVILDKLKEHGVDFASLHAVVGRGGLIKSIASGTYKINEKMLNDLRIGVQGQHTSNLGGLIAHDIAKDFNIPAFIVDPVIVDEMDDIARISGIPEISRKSIFHALNQKAVAKRYAKEKGLRYEELNLIVAHMGGGISVGVHRNGKVVDVNNALDGEGPFSPERTGSLPVGGLIDLCYSGKYTKEELMKKIVGKGGVVAYLGTYDIKEALQMAEDGDKEVELILKAMAYQIAKEIGACAAVLYGKVDAIILTGGIAYSSQFVGWVVERVKFIGDVVIYPGENELLALAEGALRVLRGEEDAKEYW